jgi:transposase-like protein
MDPTTVFCPNRHCAARGQTGRGNISIHSQKEQRFICHACHKTFSATKGTVFYRLRTAAETVSLVVTLLAHGCPVQAIVAAFGFDERTVAAWWARSSRQGQAVHEYLVEQPRDLGQVQAEALRVRRCAVHCPLLFCTDGLCSYIRAIRETFRDPVHTGQGGRPRLRPWRHVFIAQVVKHYARRRVVATDRRIVDGTPARVETLRRRSQGGGVINTAYIERLNATFRERLAPLARRCRALARYTLTLHEGMCVVGTVYNFCTPHVSLSYAHKTTPAMAAGITDHCWTVRELLSFRVPLSRWAPPKRRGRPSHALKCLIKRWCS